MIREGKEGRKEGRDEGRKKGWQGGREEKLERGKRVRKKDKERYMN
jgi:hypothetical protein